MSEDAGSAGGGAGGQGNPGTGPAEGNGAPAPASGQAGGKPAVQAGSGSGGSGAPEGGTDGGTQQRTPEEEIAHWKAQARKHETRAREGEKAARKLQEIEDAQKSDLQKAEERAAAAEAKAAETEATHNRVLAAATHDLPPELVDFLGTGTAEDINERADTVARVINERVEALVAERTGQTRNGHTSAAAAAAARNGRPVESLRPGAAPADAGNPRNSNDWFRSMVAGRPS